ncbi:MAG: hypothetical protein HYX86_02440 [Chloroflexi bacterium]|nr:hypothetical protein [Chloroflexota bacterium]
MPKPTRRERRLGKVKPPRRPFIPQATPPRSAAEQVKDERTLEAAARISPGEYEYIYKDLRRIAILAGIMFAALFILSFLIQ